MAIAREPIRNYTVHNGAYCRNRDSGWLILFMKSLPAYAIGWTLVLVFV